MAKRAVRTFHSAVSGSLRTYQTDSVVPDDVADQLGELVYDDGAPKPRRKSTES